MFTPNKGVANVGLKKSDFSIEAEQRAQKRQLELIEEDIKRVCNPNITAPFASIEDALTRLLPYHIFYEEDALFLSPDEPPVDSAIAARSTPAVWNEYISRRAAETAQKTTEIKAKIEKLRARLADPSRKRPEEHYLLARLQAEEDKAFVVEAQAAAKAQIDAENAEIEAQRSRALAALQSQQKTDEPAQADALPNTIPPLQGTERTPRPGQAPNQQNALGDGEEEDPGGWTEVEDAGGWTTVEEPGGWTTVKEPGGWTTVGMLPPVEERPAPGTSVAGPTANAEHSARA